MTDFYVEPKSYPAYSATPPNTSTAYDGDGLAKGVANPAYVSIDLTGYTAAAGNTVTVCGAVLTCVTSGAGANQFNAGSGSTLAANLASAIIAATNAVNAAATNWLTPQLRNACYASASGAVLTIQTRAGSAVYNSNTLWKVVSSGLTGGSQLDNTFANGTSGAWGHWFSDYDDGSYFPLAVNRCAYGIMFTGTATTGHAPLAGPTGNSGISATADVIHIRCNDKTLYTSSDNENTTRGWSINRPGFYLFDDGTEWPTGAGYLVAGTRNSGGNVQANGPASGVTPVSLVNRSTDWSKGLKIATLNASRSTINIGAPANGSETVLDGILFVDQQANITVGNGGAAWSELTVRRCKWSVTRNTWYRPLSGVWSSSFPNSRMTVEGCVFDFSPYSGANSYLVETSGAPPNYSSSACLTFRNNKLIAASAGHVVCNAYIGSFIQVENCQGFAVNTSFGLVGLTASPLPADIPMPYVVQQGLLSAEQFRYEGKTHILDWDPTGAYPTYNAYLPDGTPWSTRLTWSNSANVQRINGVEVYRRSQRVEESGLQTVELELLFDSAITPTNAHFGIAVGYTKASDSSIAYEYSNATMLPRQNGNTTLPTSSASWTKPGSYSTWTARKITLVLSDDIKQNTNIDVSLIMFKANPSGGITTVFINPEPTVSA